jgi:nitrogen fixation NifU-like protein
MMEVSTQLYDNLIMERFREPRHAGRRPGFNLEAEGENPLCGDRIHLFFAGDGSVLSHESKGCAIMIASADLMADAVAGKDAAQIRQLQAAFEAVVNTGTSNPALGALNALANISQYRSRIRCATLPWTTLGLALEGAE